MFYSHTFLARKGPLGTVWIAAHLQHKLRKTHYMSTDIRSTAEQIMFPDVPIALRMSGHLLLGVVRIYSKKVDYLFQDCNYFLVTLKNAFVPVEEVNLPPSATQAQFHNITLPETYELDALDIDNGWSSMDTTQDDHSVSHEEITIKDPTPSQFQGKYFTVTFDDDISRSEEVPEDAHVPMGEDSVRRQFADVDIDGSKVPLADDNLNFDNETEVMRDADTDHERHFAHTIELQIQQNTPSSSSKSPGLRHTDKEKDNLDAGNTLIYSPEKSPMVQQRSSSLRGSPHDAYTHVSFGGISPNLAIQSSPLPKPQPPGRRRKRKQFFDESTVLSNEYMKRTLKDYSDLVRKKKKLACSALDTWRFNKKKRMKQTYIEPAFSGLCSDLQSIFEKGFIFANPSLKLSDESSNGRLTNEQPPEVTEAIETFRSDDHNAVHLTHDFMPSSVPSPAHHNEHTPLYANTGVPNMTTPGTFTHVMGLETQMPVTSIDNEYGSTFMDAFDDELSILEMDNSAATECHEVQGDGTMSARTRAVALYLKKHSPASRSSAESVCGDIGLNSVLEGRSSKLCARMFFETLTLKTYGLIDVQQDLPYGDITLKVLSRISKGQF